MEDSKDFLIDPLPDRFDIIISNTPYDKKELFFRRAIECGMPFALLLPLESLGNKKIAQMVEENGVVIGILTPQPKFLHNGELKSYPGVCGWFLGNFNDSKKIELFYIHT